VNRRDRGVVGGLVLALAAIAVAIAAPAFTPAPIPSPSPSPIASQLTPYREGMLGRPTSVSPLTARTDADRALVGLVFSGLLRLGPGHTLVPDLASGWSADEEGAVYTVTLRPDAAWDDGEPVTADDVTFTFEALRDPVLAGSAGASWENVEVEVVDRRTVRFRLATPLGGFPELLTRPLAPAHLLEGIPAESLADHPFGRQPIGSGPFRLVEWTPLRAVLEPAVPIPLEGAGAGEASDAPATDSLATPGPTARPDRPRPYLDRLEVLFYPTAEELGAALGSGEIDAAVGLPGADATTLAASSGARLLRYPTADLAVVVLDLRSDHRELRDARVRKALLAIIDRSALIDEVLGGVGERADSPIPPASWAFDPAKSPPVANDRRAAATLLREAGWRRTDAGWVAPKATKPYVIELLGPDEATDDRLWTAAGAVAADWRSFGFTVDHVGLPIGQLLEERLRPGDFTAAVLEFDLTLDPDLYPLLASTQIVSSGLNLSGVQDPELDKRLVAARQPGTPEARMAAYGAVQEYLAGQQFLLPLYSRDVAVVLSDRLVGPAVRQIGGPGDRYWDVLTWRLATGR
jgi:peptide/nickel transport system substrate-binding protein